MTHHFKPSGEGKPNGRNANSANRIRIIGGEWRSRVIEFSDGEGLRPTANRVRETLFNWLGQKLHDKRCLDLFAGSGAIGYEAASRGASEVVLVENSRSAMLALKQNQEKLDARQCRLILGDATEYLMKNHGKFDIIFLDEAFEFLNSLEKKHSEKILYNIRKSQTAQNPELFKKLNDEIWEFRTLYQGLQYRLLAFWDKTDKTDTLVISTHGFVKKRSKVPESEILKAKQLRIEYFEVKERLKRYS